MTTKRTPEETTVLKDLLAGRVASGRYVTDAAAELRIGWRELKRWKDSDPAFVEDLEAAQQHLCEVLSVRSANAHLECADSRQAQVLQKGLQWYVEKQHPTKFSPRLKVEDDRVNADLLQTLRDAMTRIGVPEETRRQVLEQQSSGEYAPRRMISAVTPEDLQL